MPPKRKKKVNLEKKRKTEKELAPWVAIDYVVTAEMTREQLEMLVLRLKEELEREREERSLFQVDKDKIRTFWEITIKELNECKALLRNKDREIEVANEENEEKIRRFRQKVKHLQYEHEKNLGELKAEAMLTLQKAQDNHTEQENELLRDKKNLKYRLREQESINNEIQAMKLQQSDEVYNTRKRFQEMALQLEIRYNKLFENLKQELKTKHEMEINEVEERKKQHIKDLTEEHRKAYIDVKNYYNDITLNNLALINTLKSQMEELRKQNDRMLKQVSDVTAENKRLIEPLHHAQNEANELRRKLFNYEKDKIAFANTTLILNQTKQKFDDLTWVNNALELRFEKMQAERDELNHKFVQGVSDVQQKTGLKNLLLQQKITQLEQQLELKESVLGELVTVTQVKPDAVNKKLETLLKNKNDMIKDLQYELARLAKSHDDLLRTYEAKLQRFGVPLHELGFTPLRILPPKQTGLTKGPAGLVTKNK